MPRKPIGFALLIISAAWAVRVDAGQSGAELVPAELLPRPETRGSSADALSLAELEAIALRHHPTLATAAARVEAARGRHHQAGLYPNPTAGYHATEIGNLGTAGQQGAFLRQRIITAGKLQLDQGVAAREISESRFRWRAQRQRVLSDLRVRFYDAWVAQRRVRWTAELASIGDGLVQATHQLIEARQATENDRLQAEIQADESHILLDNARNQSTEAWRRLMALAGVPDLPAVPLVAEPDVELPVLNWDQCYAMVLGNHPELNAARTRVERACIALRRAELNPIPDVDLSVSIRHHNVSGSDVANVQLGVPVPIFNKNQGNIRSAAAELAAARTEVKRIELYLQDQLAVAYRRYANARQQTDRYEHRIVPRAEESLRLVADGYRQGQVEYLTLLTAQQTYVEVSLSYLDSLQELRAALSLIQGQLLTDSLAAGR